MKETNTRDQQAQEYAEKKIENEYGISREDFIEAGCRFGYDDVIQAYLDGYTACEQSDLRISVAKLREILNELASVRGVVNESVDDIINRIKKEI